MQQANTPANKRKDAAMQNQTPCFIGYNPVTAHCPQSVFPCVHPSAYVGPFACIIGDVTIEENVFIAPQVIIRADEGTPFHIGAHTNLQDGVTLHGLAGEQISYKNSNYSIYLGQHVSCGHGCVIHGPCVLEDDVFVGFYALVLNAIVGEGCFIAHHAVVTGGVRIAPRRYVPAGEVVDTQQKADELTAVSKADTAFAAEVQHVNSAFPAAYEGLSCTTANTCEGGK